MIQRVQSLLLGLVAILHVLLFFVPVFVWDGYHGPEGPLQDVKPMTALYNMPFIVLNSLIIVLSIFIIFQYKARKKQRSFVFVLTAVIVINICLYLFYAVRITVANEYLFVWTKSIGIYFQLLSIVLCFFAAKRIKKDEDLVKSVDRIR